MKSDYTQILILLLIMATGIIAWLVWSAKREISDANAMFWASYSQPLFYISRTPFDDSVLAQADEAKANLLKYGNKWLNPDTDIFCWVYRSDIANTSGDFAVWDELATKRKEQAIEAFRVQKTAFSQTAAHAKFSQQTASQN